MKIDFCLQLFENYSNIKFHEIPFSLSLVFPDSTDRWSEMQT